MARISKTHNDSCQLCTYLTFRNVSVKQLLMSNKNIKKLNENDKIHRHKDTPAHFEDFAMVMQRSNFFKQLKIHEDSIILIFYHLSR